MSKDNFDDESNDERRDIPQSPQKQVTRRDFLGHSAIAGAAAFTLKNASAQSLEPSVATEGSGSIQAPTRTGNPNLSAFVRRERTYAVPADVIVGLSEEALNKFLVAHFDNNPAFYDRGRDKKVPIYKIELNDHGIPRTIKFYAKITKAGATPAVSIDLRQSPATQTRFTAWWRMTHGAASVSADTKLPPNIAIQVPMAILQVDFPKLDGSGTYHEVDFRCSISTAAFMLLKDEGDMKVLQLIDWDIVVNGINDPLDPNDPIWGAGNPACTAELMRLRLMIRDAFTLGANVALTELSKTLTRTLPLPPLDIVKGTKIVPRELFITEQTVAISANLEPSSFSSQLMSRFEFEMQKFEGELKASGVDLQDVLMKSPKNDPAKLEAYLNSTVPAYKTLSERHAVLKKRMEPTGQRAPVTTAAMLPSTNVFVMLSGNVFDVLAKSFLSADKRDCTPWWRPVDILAGYAQGRACYWLQLSGAHGALSGTTVSGGCNVKAGGGLELQACIRIPCAPDQCATYKPGFGLKGPMNVRLAIENFEWDDNKALRLKPRVDDFPGFEVYGLPPVVGDLANAILNLISGVILKALLNAALSLFDFKLVEIPQKIASANVTVKVDNFGVANIDGMLTVTGRTRFS